MQIVARHWRFTRETTNPGYQCCWRYDLLRIPDHACTANVFSLPPSLTRYLWTTHISRTPRASRGEIAVGHEISRRQHRAALTAAGLFEAQSRSCKLKRVGIFGSS